MFHELEENSTKQFNSIRKTIQEKNEFTDEIENIKKKQNL